MAYKYKAGNIVIGNFPYSDKEDSKKRLILIIATPYPFIWGLMVTSQFTYDNKGKYQISQNDIDFQLDRPSIICYNVIQTIDPKICSKPLGNLTSECLERIKQLVFDYLNSDT